MKTVRFVGLDVHAETIAAAVAEPDGEVRFVGVIANRSEWVCGLVKKLGKPQQLRVCYEAGPTGMKPGPTGRMYVDMYSRFFSGKEEEPIRAFSKDRRTHAVILPRQRTIRKL